MPRRDGERFSAGNSHGKIILSGRLLKLDPRIKVGLWRAYRAWILRWLGRKSGVLAAKNYRDTQCRQPAWTWRARTTYLAAIRRTPGPGSRALRVIGLGKIAAIRAAS